MPSRRRHVPSALSVSLVVLLSVAGALTVGVFAFDLGEVGTTAPPQVGFDSAVISGDSDGDALVLTLSQGPAVALSRLRLELEGARAGDGGPVELVDGVLAARVPGEEWETGESFRLDRTAVTEPSGGDHPGRLRLDGATVRLVYVEAAAGQPQEYTVYERRF